MIAMKRSCLTPDELRQTLAGNLGSDGFDDALAHLDECEACRENADELQTKGQWIVESLADEAIDPLQAETACQMALWRMLETPASQQPLPVPTADAKTLGPYRLKQTLGQGGMGTVYLAEHERLKRQVAIKLLPRERVDTLGWLDRFDREMTAVAALEHPNVVRATDAGHEDGWHYLVMEYLKGLDVGQVAHRMTQLPIADACEIVRQAALGLVHVHEAGLVHRDIKPSNLMLCQSGTVKVLDLGLVLAGDDPLSKDDRLTTVGHLMGTMPYMAPEQLADSRSVCPRADIYSLGATLFRLIAGRTPHQKTGNLAAHILAITGTDAPPLSKFRTDVDADLENLVREMLSRDAQQRPASAAQVAKKLEPARTESRLKPLLREALRRPVSSEGAPSRLPSVASSKPPTRRPNWVAWAMGGSLAACLLLAGFLLKLQTEKGELIVHSQQDDVTVLVKQDDEIIERLTIESTQPRRTVLRKGTYRVEIDGGGEALQLSKEVVTIGSREQERIDVTQRARNDAAAATLFKGQSLEHWMSVLTREKEVDAIGEAMFAVEALTREGPAVPRRSAAEATLELARQHGGMRISSLNSFGNSAVEIVTNSDAFSRRFMAYFLETFPNYFADPGLELIERELRRGTSQSRIASVMALYNFLGGFRDGSSSHESKREAANSLTHFAKKPDSVRLIETVCSHLLESDKGGPKDPQTPDYLSETAGETALKLTLASERPIVGLKWAEDRLRKKFDKIADSWKKADPAERIGDIMNAGLWILPAEYYLPIIELAEAYPEEAKWDVVAGIILCDQHFGELLSDHQERVFASVASNAPSELIDGIETHLFRLLNNARATKPRPKPKVTFSNAGGGMGGGMGGGGFTPVPKLLVTLSPSVSPWQLAVPFYATKADDPAGALVMLNEIRQELVRHDAATIYGSGTEFELVDKAIEILKKRQSK